MTPLTADELVILVKARDLLYDKRNSDDGVMVAHDAVVDVMRYSYLDVKDERD